MTPGNRSYQLVLLSSDVGDIHVMGGRAQFLEFLASEDVDSDKMNLCMPVLSSLRGGHIDDLAWAVLDNNKSILSQCGTLHGISGRCASVCDGIESVFMLFMKDNG